MLKSAVDQNNYYKKQCPCAFKYYRNVPSDASAVRPILNSFSVGSNCTAHTLRVLPSLEEYCVCCQFTTTPID